MEEQLLLSIITSGFDTLGSSLTGAITNIIGLGAAFGPVGIAIGAAIAAFDLLTSAITFVADAAKAGFELIKDFIVGSTEIAISFESAFANVAKTVEGLAVVEDGITTLTAEGEALREELEDLAERTPISFEDIAATAAVAGQLGIQADELGAFTEAMVELTVAADLTGKDATTAMAKFLNVMGTLETDDVAGDVRRVADVLVELGNTTATTETAILNFAQRIAGIGSTVGLTEFQILALGASFTEVGGRVEASGTAVQKTLIAMDTATKTLTSGFADNTTHIASESAELRELEAKLLQAQIRMQGFTDETNAGTVALQQIKIDELGADIDSTRGSIERLTESNGKFFEGGSEQLTEFARVAGLSASEFATEFEDNAGNALQLFIEGLARLDMEGENAAAVLKDLELGDQRLARSFLAVAGAGDLLATNMEAASEEFETGGALAEEAAKKFGTVENRMETLRNRFIDFRSEVGDQFLPLWSQVLSVFEESEGVISDVVLEAFTELAEALQGPLTFALENAQILFEELLVVAEDALPFLIQAFEALLVVGEGVVVFLGEALPVAIDILRDIWARLTDEDGPITVMILLWENRLKPALEELFGELGERGPEILEAFSEVWQALVLPAIQLAIDLVSVAIIIFSLLAEVFFAVIPPAIDTFLAIWGVMFDALVAVDSFIKDTLFPIFDAVALWFSETLPPALETTLEWWALFQEAMIILGEFTQDHLIPLLLELANLFEVILAKAVEILLAIWESQLQPALEETWAFIQDNLNPILIALGDWVGTVSEKTVTLEEDITNKLNPALEFARQAVEALRGALASIGSFLDSVAARVRSLADAISNLSVPAPFQTESPPPFAVGLSIIREEVLALTNALPQLTKSLFDLDSPRRDPGISKSETFSDNRKFILNAQSMMSPGELALEFRTMELATR